MRAHLLVFDGSQIERRVMQKTVDRLRGVVNWYAFFDNAMCLASEQTAREISQQVRDVLPDLRFIVSTIDSEEKAGWMPKSIWGFLNDPKPADSEAA